MDPPYPEPERPEVDNQLGDPRFEDWVERVWDPWRGQYIPAEQYMFNFHLSGQSGGEVPNYHPEPRVNGEEHMFSPVRNVENDVCDALIELGAEEIFPEEQSHRVLHSNSNTAQEDPINVGEQQWYQEWEEAEDAFVEATEEAERQDAEPWRGHYIPAEQRTGDFVGSSSVYSMNPFENPELFEQLLRQEEEEEAALLQAVEEVEQVESQAAIDRAGALRLEAIRALKHATERAGEE